MDIIKVLAAYARWHVRIKAFVDGKGTWAQVLSEHHQLRQGNRWLYEAPHLRHCPEYAELMNWLPTAELAIETLMGDLDRAAMTRASLKLTIGSPFYRTVGRYKIALHGLHEAIEAPMGLRDTLKGRRVPVPTTFRPARPTVRAS